MSIQRVVLYVSWCGSLTSIPEILLELTDFQPGTPLSMPMGIQNWKITPDESAQLSFKYHQIAE
jgi:hypothetical protein